MAEWIVNKTTPKDFKARKRGEPIIPIKERLYSNSKLNEKTGCWEWQGYKQNGYGKIGIGSRTDGTRRTTSTHRLSYELNFGEIPKGMEVCHKCDNPCCIRPDHLFVGTRQDNIDDRERKGRNNPPFGSKHAQAKLTEEQVISIREERLCKNTPIKKLAKRYGVCKKTMQDLLKGKNWKHLKLPPPPEAE
jgi:hypothetical protein